MRDSFHVLNHKYKIPMLKKFYRIFSYRQFEQWNLENMIVFRVLYDGISHATKRKGFCDSGKNNPIFSVW